MMGATFINNGSKTWIKKSFKGLFRTVKKWSKGICVLFHNCWWNINPLLHTGDKITIKEWVSSRESAPKKAKRIPLAEKVMANVFWDSCGIIFIGYLEKESRRILWSIIGPFEWPRQSRTNILIWQKRLCFFIMKTHQLTNL